MKIHANNIGGIWFALFSSCITIVFILREGAFILGFNDIVGFVVINFSSYCVGQRYGKRIIFLDNGLKKATQSFIYGVIAGFFIMLACALLASFLALIHQLWLDGNFLLFLKNLSGAMVISLIASTIWYSFPVIPVFYGSIGLFLYFMRNRFR